MSCSVCLHVGTQCLQVLDTWWAHSILFAVADSTLKENDASCPEWRHLANADSCVCICVIHFLLQKFAPKTMYQFPLTALFLGLTMLYADSFLSPSQAPWPGTFVLLPVWGTQTTLPHFCALLLLFLSLAFSPSPFSAQETYSVYKSLPRWHLFWEARNMF